MEKSRPPVLMFSGGLDSLIAWFALGKPKAIHVHLGHRYGASEYFTSQAIAKRLGMDLVVEKRLYLGDQERPDAYIPMRNLFLAMIGALYGDTIYMVFQKGEQSIPDRSTEFLAKVSEFLTFLNGRLIKVDSPFQNMTKTAMIKWYLDQGNDKCPVDVLYKSFSCFEADSTQIPCGKCAACFRRWVAFDNNSLSLALRADIKEWPGIQDYIKKIKNGEYDLERARETEAALRRHGLW
jgi:7-cyano-7-deazaguanine synthase